MRFLGPAVASGSTLLILAAILAVGGAARADQCPQKGSPIETDRPDVTNSSLVVPQGSFQNENGVNFSAPPGGHEFDGTNSRLRLGIAPCLEVFVDVPTYFAPVSGSLPAGFTNVAPAIKWQISPVPGKLDLSATLGVGLPTGTSAITGPGVQPYIQFPWSWSLADGWAITGMFTNFLVPGDPNKQFFTETTLVLEREFGERSFLFVEFVGDYRLDGGPSYLINSGAGFRITPQQQIDFHVAVGLNENAPAYIVGIGYSYRIDGLF
jgi:Putative MetA-pathway of phenol degradation